MGPSHFHSDLSKVKNAELRHFRIPVFKKKERKKTVGACGLRVWLQLRLMIIIIASSSLSSLGNLSLGLFLLLCLLYSSQVLGKGSAVRTEQH